MRKKIEDENIFELLCRKGVYPYEYFDSWDKFTETKLPDIEEYYSALKDENISKDDYEFAKTLYNSFKLQNLGELHDLYMATDVMLLADVFESFRETALAKYELDPVHYITGPSLSWAG